MATAFQAYRAPPFFAPGCTGCDRLISEKDGFEYRSSDRSFRYTLGPRVCSSPLEEGGFEPLVPLTRKRTKATEPRAPLPGALVWERIEKVADHWLPEPTILHSRRNKDGTPKTMGAVADEWRRRQGDAR